MKHIKRFILILVAVFAIVLTAKVVYAFEIYARVERRFPSIHLGDERDSVIARLGEPNYYHGKCGVIHSPAKNCSLEFVYSHPFAPLIPEYHIVSFSKNDRVIESDDWESP